MIQTVVGQAKREAAAESLKKTNAIAGSLDAAEGGDDEATAAAHTANPSGGSGSSSTALATNDLLDYQKLAGASASTIRYE